MKDPNRKPNGRAPCGARELKRRVRCRPTAETGRAPCGARELKKTASRMPESWVHCVALHSERVYRQKMFFMAKLPAQLRWAKKE